ncbi:MAG: peptide deformylase [Actinomycetota bacterium]|jgi:peptide deformylase|nr:peptide deformylase [Actinomycetota bacterium]
MAPYDIRLVGDPVLRQPASEVTEIDDRLVRLAEDMVATMYEAPGIGLAAPQVGVQKRLFVYDLHDEQGAHVIVNPVISETRGEWVYEEGCLSVPDLSWEIVRPKEVHLRGIDLDGNEVSFEADELLARMFQHEVDHLDGILLLERLDPEQAKEAKRVLRDRALAAADDEPRRRLRLPDRG